MDSCNKKKILLVDDDETTRKLVELRLEDEGYELLTANDGTECIKLAESNIPDLIILDIMMPVMDGYTCLKEMRRMPKIKHIPVIMLSGKEEDKVKDLFSFQNISGYVEKPFNCDDELIAKIKEVLGQ